MSICVDCVILDSDAYFLLIWADDVALPGADSEYHIDRPW